MLQTVTNIKNIKDDVFFVYVGVNWCKACETPKYLLEKMSDKVIYETSCVDKMKVNSIPSLICFRKGEIVSQTNISEMSTEDIKKWMDLAANIPTDVEKEMMLKKWADKGGRNYGYEFNKEEIEEMKNDKIVAFMGASDDLIEIIGAIDDELDCYTNATFGYRSGKFIRNKNTKFNLKVTHNRNNCCFWLDSNVMYSTFVVMDEDEPYCRGIFVSLYDIVDNL